MFRSGLRLPWRRAAAAALSDAEGMVGSSHSRSELQLQVVVLRPETHSRSQKSNGRFVFVAVAQAVGAIQSIQSQQPSNWRDAVAFDGSDGAPPTNSTGRQTKAAARNCSSTVL